MIYPDDVDGDVFRRLNESGFDFCKEVEVDFNLDFNYWPLKEDTIKYLFNEFPNGKVVEPDEEDLAKGIDKGYFTFSVKTLLTYEFVMSMQEKLTKMLSNYDGYCDSWGVMQD